LLRDAAEREAEELAEPTSLVFGEHGRVVLASASASRWLAEPARAAALGARAAEVAREGVEAVETVIHGVRAAFVRLEGAGDAVLVTLSALSPPILTPDAVLS